MAARIRQALGQGVPHEEIVEELVGGGLSPATAKRFVERVSAEAATSSAPPEPRRETDEAGEDASGRWGMIGGSFWLSLGCTVTGLTYALAEPGGRYTVAYGAVIAGLVAFGRGVKRWLAHRTAFPLTAVLVVSVLPPLGAASLLGYRSWRDGRREAARVAAADARVAEAEARQAEERRRAEREAADAAREKRQAERVQRALDQVRNSNHSTILCDAALELGRSGKPELARDLRVLIRSAPHYSVQGCAAEALVQLGDLDVPLALYIQWARSDSRDLQRSAIIGFGKLGPARASTAVPYLATALQSSEPGMRLHAVLSLARLGPAGEPLLREASLDADESVRDAASRALVSERASREPSAPAASAVPPVSSDDEAAPVLLLSLSWSAQLHEPWTPSRSQGPWPSPAIGRDGTLYVGGPRSIYAVNRSGELLWTAGRFPPQLRYVSVDDEGRVLSVDLWGTLVVVDADGNVGEQLGLSEMRGGPAQGMDGTLFAPGGNGHPLWAIATDTWRPRWQIGRKGEPGWATPAVGREGTVFAARQNGELQAIHPEGWKEWSARLGTPAGAASVGQGGRIYVGDGQGTLSACSRDGRVEWTFRTDGPVVGQTVTSDDGNLFVATMGGTLYALTALGTERWSFELGWPIAGTPALAADGSIYVGARDGGLYALTRDGAEKWRYEAEGAAFSPTLGLDGTVYLHSADGTLRALADRGNGGLMQGTPWAKWGSDGRNTGREGAR